MKKILPYLLIAMLIASTAFGVTAYRYTDSVTTVRGDAVGAAYITVYNANTTVKAPLYLGNDSTTQAVVNPTRSDGYGRFSFYLVPGTYDITISGANITTYTIEDVRIYSENDYSYNVKDYGAVSDDLLDDSTAINAAVAAAVAAGVGQVRIPTGVYKISTPITIGSNIDVFGDGPGATIVMPTSSSLGIDGFVLDTADNSSVSNMTIMAFRRTGAAKAYGVKIVAGYNNTVSNCMFTLCDHAGVSVQYDSDIYGALSDSMSIVMSGENEFDGGYHIIRDNRFEYSVEGMGVEIMRSDRCVVINNVFHDNALWDIRITGSIGTHVSGNRMDGSAAGIVVQGYGDPLPIGVTKPSRQIDVVGNNINAGSGVKIYSGAFDCSVVGNNITATNDTAGICIDIPHTADKLNRDNSVGDLLVEANLMSGGAIGIALSAEGYGVDVRDNMISDFDWIGVYASATADTDTIRGLIIEGNTIRPGWNAPSRSAKYGMWLEGALLSGIFRDNYLDTFGYGGTWTEYTGTSSMSAFLSDAQWDDLVVPAANIGTTPATAPAEATWKGGIKVYSFVDTGGKFAHLSAQLPHGYVPATDIKPHFHFTTPDSIQPNATVKFRFLYTKTAINAAAGDTATVMATFTNNDAARLALPAGSKHFGRILPNTHLICGGATIVGTGLGLSSVIYGNIERGPADTHMGAVYLLSADIHYRRNRFGTANEYTD